MPRDTRSSHRSRHSGERQRYSHEEASADRPRFRFRTGVVELIGPSDLQRESTASIATCEFREFREFRCESSYSEESRSRSVNITGDVRGFGVLAFPVFLAAGNGVAVRPTLPKPPARRIRGLLLGNLW